MQPNNNHHAPFHKSTNHSTTLYEFFTGGNSKTAEMAIYFNVACANIEKAEKQIEDWSDEKKTIYLTELFWKTHRDRKNSNGYVPSETDKKMIHEVIQKLNEFRNYHSHIWHDNGALACSPELVKFVEEKYEKALGALYEEDPKGVIEYEARLKANRNFSGLGLFKAVSDGGKTNIHDPRYITQEGRLFFLSFFLTTGQMSQLLQQHKGSKRTDMPLYRMKHLLYKFYCHRDGSSLFDLNHQENVLSSLSNEESNNILHARTAYKLITYLYDYPHFWGDSKTMPLYLSVDNNIQEVSTVQHLLAYIKSNQMLSKFLFSELVLRKENEEDRQQIRSGTVAFTFQSLAHDHPAHGFTYHISFDTLHRLTVMALLHKQNIIESDPETTMIDNLKVIGQKRREVYNILAKQINERTTQDEQFLLDRENQYLRGGRNFTNKVIDFFDAYRREWKEPQQTALYIANACRTEHQPYINHPEYGEDEISPEPLLVHLYDLVATNAQKFRSGNRFVFYAAKFLMDFAGDNWYWGVETFEVNKKGNNDQESLLRKKAYYKSSQIPKNYRLTIEEDHVFIALPKDLNAKSNHERFYLFTIGPKALKYLIAFCTKPTNKPFEQVSSFLDFLKNELSHLSDTGKWNKTDTYQLLEPKYVPAYMRPSNNKLNTAAELIIKIRSRAEHVITQWQQSLNKINKTKRAVKNKVVMDAYRFFEWPVDDQGRPKFFRANEFNEMSVCHYSLQPKEERPKHSGYQQGRYKRNEKSKFAHLFEDLFNLKNRKPAIPKEIVSHLHKAESLDELMKNVIENRTDWLKSTIETLSILPSSPQKKQLLRSLCSKLGVSIPTMLRTGPGLEQLESDRANSLTTLPFPIDPSIVTKYFFPEEFRASKESKRKDVEGNFSYQPLQIANNIRKDNSSKAGLYLNHYSEKIPRTIYGENDTCKKQKQKLIGRIQDILTEDILLWRIAQKYLGNSEYTRLALSTIKDNRNNNWHVGNLHGSKMRFPLTDNGGKKYYTELLMHQMDDVIFTTSKLMLIKLVRHYLNRHNEMIKEGIWTDQQLRWGKIDPAASLPDGTAQNPIPFSILQEEQRFVHRTGQRFVQYILDFERTVLTTAMKKKAEGDKEKLQNFLITKSSKKGNPKNYDHLNFSDLLQLAQELDISGLDVIKAELEGKDGYRNILLHNDVPLAKGSFSKLTQPGSRLRQALNITEDLHSIKDRSNYVIETGLTN